MTETIGVLIIDDSEDDRALYRRTLAKSAESTYEIAEAEDGEAGLARLDELSPDCVLLDYSLPGRNGVEVLKRLRVKHPFVPVVMLTGQGSETVAVTAMQEGAQNYISKATITPEALQRAIRVAIEHCAMERRIQEQRSSLEIFTRALAHDLKEPVRTIKSFLTVICLARNSHGTRPGLFQLYPERRRPHGSADRRGLFLYEAGWWNAGDQQGGLRRRGRAEGCQGRCQRADPRAQGGRRR